MLLKRKVALRIKNTSRTIWKNSAKKEQRNCKYVYLGYSVPKSSLLFHFLKINQIKIMV